MWKNISWIVSIVLISVMLFGCSETNIVSLDSTSSLLPSIPATSTHLDIAEPKVFDYLSVTSQEKVLLKKLTTDSNLTASKIIKLHYTSFLTYLPGFSTFPNMDHYLKEYAYPVYMVYWDISDQPDWFLSALPVEGDVVKFYYCEDGELVSPSWHHYQYSFWIDFYQYAENYSMLFDPTVTIENVYLVANSSTASVACICYITNQGIYILYAEGYKGMTGDMYLIPADVFLSIYKEMDRIYQKYDPFDDEYVYVGPEDVWDLEPYRVQMPSN